MIKKINNGRILNPLRYLVSDCASYPIVSPLMDKSYEMRNN